MKTPLISFNTNPDHLPVTNRSTHRALVPILTHVQYLHLRSDQIPTPSPVMITDHR